MNIDGEDIILTLYDGEICSGKGITPMSAVADAEAQSGKSISIGHVELIMLGEGEYPTLLEGFIMSGTPSPSSFVVYCESQVDYKRDVLELTSDLEAQAKNLKLARKNICETLDGIISISECAAIPYISDDISGMAVIGKSELLYKLSEEASKGLAFLSGDIVDTFDENNAHIISVNCDIDASLENGQISAEICVKVRCSKPVDDESLMIERVETLCNQALRETALKGYDTIGIEKALGSATSKIDKKEWAKLLKAGNYNVKVELS